MTFRLAALVVALANLILSPILWGQSARADTSYRPSFEQRFGPIFNNLALKMLTCLEGTNRSSMTEVLFIGASRSNLHLGEAQRRDLNARAANVINQSGAYRANPIEPAGILPPIMQGGGSVEKLQETLKQRYDAPVILKFETRRPTVESLQLHIVMLGRKADGSYGCTQTDSMYLDASSLDERGRPQNDFDLVTLKGAYLEGLRLLANRIQSAERLVVSASTELDGRCALKTQLQRDFAAYLFRIRREDAPLGGLGGDWPLIEIDDGSGGTPDDNKTLNLSVLAETARIAPGVMVIRMQLARGTALLDVTRRRAVVDLTQIEGCTTPSVRVASNPDDADTAATADGASREGDAADDGETADADVSDEGDGNADTVAKADGTAAVDADGNDADKVADGGADPSAGDAGDQDSAGDAGTDTAATAKPGDGDSDSDSDNDVAASGDSDGTSDEDRASQVDGKDAVAKAGDGGADADNAPLETPQLILYSDKGRYESGDSITLFVQAPQDCRLTLFNIDDSGKSCLLYPHPALEDRVLRAGERFQYPPRGTMRTGSGLRETFVAICNGSPRALAAETRDTQEIGCEEGGGRAFEDAIHETVILDIGSEDAVGGQGGGTQAALKERQQEGLLRRSITVRIVK